MRRTLIALLAVLSMASNAFARACIDADGNNIFDEPEVFQDLIRGQKTCTEAVELARACAWEDALDVESVSAAREVCLLDLLMYDKTDVDTTKLLEQMEKACDQKYKREKGPFYLSMNEFCRLSALEWIVKFATTEGYMD